MEVVIPAAPTMDFDFNSARSTPYPSAPSSPKRFGQFFYTSAPTSPSRISEFYQEFDDLYTMSGREGSKSSSAIPFGWEQKPGTPKSQKGTANGEDDFAFDFSAESEKGSLTAEELFDGGKIRPLKPPPRLQLDEFTTLKSPLLSPRSPRSPISLGKKMIREALSPRSKKKVDSFAAVTENRRGRERRVDLSSSSRRATRSLSPYRVSEYPWEEEDKQPQQQNTKEQASSKSQAQAQPQVSKGSSRRWRLKDFLLFRSASEGRATDKDPFSKYSGLFKRNEDTRNVSSRSIDSSGSVTSSRRKGHVSAHELHYTKNKAASQDLKKKTFLPYKQGILGKVAVNPALHALANRFGTLTRS